MEMSGQFISLPALQTLGSFRLTPVKWEAVCDDEILNSCYDLKFYFFL